MNLTFGRWNNRKIDVAEVKKLVNSLEQEGIQRYAERNLVPLVIRKDLIDLEHLAATAGGGGDDLPLLHFQDDQNEPIIAPGGQHRREALKIVKRKLEATIVAKTAKSEKSKDANLELDGEIEDLKRELKGIGMWGFVIYDAGEFRFIQLQNIVP
jgi:hypothetical protein